MKISEVIQPAFVRLNFAVNSKGQLMHALAVEAKEATGSSQKQILDALNAREALGSTGIGQAIALPHAVVPGLKRPFALAARLKAPMEFNSIDSQPIEIVVLVLIPEDNGKSHVDTLACIAKQLRSPRVRERIRAARSTEELYEAFVAEVS